MRSGQPPFIRIEPKTIEAFEGSSLTINYTFTVGFFFLNKILIYVYVFEV